MIFVPLPFVVALLLAIMLVRMVRQGEAGLEQNRYFILLMSAYALQSILIGLRWGYDLREVLPVQSVLAVTIAALAWISFRNLAVEQTGASKPLIWPHFLPAGLVLVLLIFWREPVGPLITIVFLSYGTALLWLARHGPDGLIASRLDGSVVSYRSLLVTAFWIIGSAVTDVIITLDLQWTGGAYSGAVVGYANVIALLVLGGAASMASQNGGARFVRQQRASGDRRGFSRRGVCRCADARKTPLQGCRPQSWAHRQETQPAGAAGLACHQPHPRHERVAIRQQPPYRGGPPAADVDRRAGDADHVRRRISHQVEFQSRVSAGDRPKPDGVATAQLHGRAAVRPANV